MKTITQLTLATLVATVASTAVCDTATGSTNHYSPQPVTLKQYQGDKTNSASYTGQVARHVLHDSLKALAAQGNGKPNPALKEKMMAYYAGKGEGRAIIEPKDKGDFDVAETHIDQISKGKNLQGKTYSGPISGVPGNMAGTDLIAFWIDHASSANKGVDATTGYNYQQLISKFILGSVFYHQAVDVYLTKYLQPGVKPNNKPYKAGAHYSGIEHSWDEAFGYFGIPNHGAHLSAKEIYAIAKKKPEALGAADVNNNNAVELYGEMVFSPAYYAASVDKSSSTNYTSTIMTAFLNGRTLIAGADGAALTPTQRNTLIGYANVIADNWEQVYAEATFKYAGSVYKALSAIQTAQKNGANADTAIKKYIKYWGELKGFSLDLQFGRHDRTELTNQLNELIGYGPVMPNGKQVIGFDKAGGYLQGSETSIAEYLDNMKKVQQLLAENNLVTAKLNQIN